MKYLLFDAAYNLNLYSNYSATPENILLIGVAKPTYNVVKLAYIFYQLAMRSVGGARHSSLMSLMSLMSWNLYWKIISISV